MLYVRTAGPDGTTVPRSPADLASDGEKGAESRVTPQTLVSLRKDGSFEPLIDAVRRNGPVRDALAREIGIPSLRSYGLIRLAIAVVASVPILMLLELDRELVFGGKASAGRLIVDLILCAWVGFELSRPTPRMPRIAATCLAAISLRWFLIELKACGGHVHPLVWAASAFAVVGALFFLFHVPSRDRIVLELLGKLGISRSELFEASTPTPPPGALVAAAIACAAGLPAMLHLARSLGAGFFVQSLVFVGFAAAAPIAARRLGEPGRAAPSPVPPVRIMIGVAIGLALTAAAVTSGRLFFDAGAEVARCVHRLDTEARLARMVEAQELARAVEKVRTSAPLVFLTAAVFPFAEERIYRGLLQDTLVRKYGTGYGILATALAFGLAHLGVYEMALYQTVLLGLGFGIAYAEGGLLAAFFVHAVWNLLQVA